MNFDKFTIKAQEVIQGAVNIAQNHSQQVVEPEHLMLSLIDNGESVAHGGKNYKMRFYVTSASPDYNAIQALAQTGFAFQDRLNVIFPNFSSSTNFAGSCNTLDNVKCCTNVDGEGKPTYMYCPIQAITVHK